MDTTGEQRVDKYSLEFEHRGVEILVQGMVLPSQNDLGERGLFVVQARDFFRSWANTPAVALTMGCLAVDQYIEYVDEQSLQVV